MASAEINAESIGGLDGFVLARRLFGNHNETGAEQTENIYDSGMGR